MPVVRLQISPDPAHVRTARLVAVAVARRAGVADHLLDEVRLAVGEACSRAVGAHRDHGIGALVEIEFVDEPDFGVLVRDRAPGPDPGPEPDDEVPPGMALALLVGLLEDVVVRPAPDGPGTIVRMRWPSAGPPAG